MPRALPFCFSFLSKVLWYGIKQIFHTLSPWLYDLFTLGGIIFSSALPWWILLTLEGMNRIFKGRVWNICYLFFRNKVMSNEAKPILLPMCCVWRNCVFQDFCCVCVFRDIFGVFAPKAIPKTGSIVAWIVSNVTARVQHLHLPVCSFYLFVYMFVCLFVCLFVWGSYECLQQSPILKCTRGLKWCKMHP